MLNVSFWWRMAGNVGDEIEIKEDERKGIANLEFVR